MFLKEFAITRYGPLPESGRIKAGYFNLFYGPNEDGKTLTIDALLKMLFGKEASLYFDAVKRVDEEPEGYLVIEHGQDYKLPAAGRIDELAEVSSREFANIFIIRDSDLIIRREHLFYRELTARLTGMRTEEIAILMQEIQDLGRITPKGALQNSEPYKLKDRLAAVEKLAEKINKLAAALEEEGYDRLTGELALLLEKRAAIREKLELYRSAARRDLYQRGLRAMNALRQAQRSAGQLSSYNPEDYQRWQKAAATLEHQRRGRERLEREQEESLEELSAIQTQIRELRLRRENLERETLKVEEKLKLPLEKYEGIKMRVIGLETFIRGNLFRYGFPVSLAIFALLLGAAIYRPQTWLFWFLIPPVLTITGAATALFVYQKQRAYLKALDAKICLTAANLGIKVSDSAELRLVRAAQQRDLEHHVIRLTDAEKEREWLIKERDRIRVEIDYLNLQEAEEKERISDIRQKAGARSLESFQAALAEREKYIAEVKNQQAILQSHFGSGPGLSDSERQIESWESSIEELKGYRDAAPGLRYDEKTIDLLQVDLQKCEREIEKLKELEEERNRELRHLERDVNELLYHDRQEYLLCQTLVDLQAIGEKLQKWIDERKLEVEAARLLLQSLQEIEREEETKVAALFGPESPVSARLNQFTGGRYQAVCFEGVQNPLKVIDNEGRELNATQLSGATTDQLYFAIRLAFAEKLLRGKQGFFILDDPLVKADLSRLKTILHLLLQLSDQGWQFLYFSSKNEIKELLKEKILQDKVREFRIGLRGDAQLNNENAG